MPTTAPALLLLKFNPHGEQYPHGEVISYTIGSGAESQPRFGPPGFGLGTPSPGFGPGSGLAPALAPCRSCAGRAVLGCGAWLRRWASAPAPAACSAPARTVLIRGGAAHIFSVRLDRLSAWIVLDK
jgi:hypothetical protein